MNTIIIDIKLYEKLLNNLLISYAWNGSKNMSSREFQDKQLLWDKLHKEQDGKCRCCGEPLDNTSEIDHFYPHSKGGKSEYTNAQLLHKRCNIQKGDKLPTRDEVLAFIDWKLKAGV